MTRIVSGLGTLGLAAVLTLAGCSGGKAHWKTTNITGVMPDLAFALTEDNGKTVHADDFRGKVKMLYFGYTHCPDICPITLGDIAKTLHALGPKAKDVRVLFVSVDPKRDTLKLLKTYTQSFGPHFIGLTGTQGQLHKLAKRYRVSYSYGKPDADGNYVVNHSAAIFVFDKKGHVRLLMSRNDGTQAMVHDLEQLLG